MWIAFRPGRRAALLAALVAIPAGAQVLIVRADGGERSLSVTGGFVQGAVTAGLPGLDYDQISWAGGEAAHAAAVEAVKAKKARAVFTDSPEAARELLKALPELKVVLAGSERASENKFETGGRITVVLPLPAPDAFFKVVLKNFRLRKLVAPHLQERSLGLPAGYLDDKRVAITPFAVASAGSLGGLDEALAQADGVLLVPGALPGGKATVDAVAAVAAAKKLPLIALSPDWVSNGATVAVYADDGDLGTTASGQMMALLAGSGTLAYTAQFAIAVRKGAAARAGFDLKGLSLTRPYE